MERLAGFIMKMVSTKVWECEKFECRRIITATVYWCLCWRMNHEIHHSNPCEGMVNIGRGGVVIKCVAVDTETMGAGWKGEVREGR